MAATILTIRNAHRAAVVRKIAEPDLGDFQFDYRGEMINDNFMRPKYCHLAKNPCFPVPSRIYDVKEDMDNWEVVSWKYEINFEDLWDLAVRAFSGTSFSPEERGAQYIRDYEATLLDDLTNIPEDEQARYIEKYTEWVRILFNKHSRCLSSMIAGPANFPVRRAEKANNSYDAAVKEFGEWREKILKAIARRIEDAKPSEQKAAEEWNSLKCSIDSSASTIKSINEGTQRGYDKASFVSSIYGKVETYAKRGDVEIVGKAIEYIRQLNKLTSIITERHKFFKLLDVAKAAQEAQEEKENREDSEIRFDGGVVVKNFSEDRLQIIFDEKPSPDVIFKLKHNGFRWSPRFGAWQRQLTANAVYKATRVIPVTEEQLKDI